MGGALNLDRPDDQAAPHGDPWSAFRDAFDIGGVAPTGHPAPLPTLIDEDLADYPQIWAAGGTPHTVFPMTFDELVALTGGQVVKVD